MPVKLLLNPSSLQVTRLLHMSLGPSINPSRVQPIFCRIFPFKLKYQGFGPQVESQLGARRLSTRPFRPRPSSEFNRRGGGGGGGREVRASKSLIEDEAELSDWVSEVRKTNSFGGRFASEDESDSRMVRNSGKRDRRRERVRDRDGEGFSMKRRREGDLEEPNWRRNGAKSESFSRNAGISKRLDSDEQRYYNSGRKNRDFGPRRDGKGFRGGKRDFLEDHDGRGRKEKDFGSRRDGKGFRGGRRDFLDDDNDDNDGNEKGYNLKRKNWGNMNSFSGKRGGGEMGFGSRRDGKVISGGKMGFGSRRDGKVLSGGKRGFFDDDDDDDEEDGGDIDEDARKGLVGRLGDLISEEESDDDDEEHDDAGGVSKINEPSSFGQEKEHSVINTPSSPRSFDSYLSETRYLC